MERIENIMFSILSVIALINIFAVMYLIENNYHLKQQLRDANKISLELQKSYLEDNRC